MRQKIVLSAVLTSILASIWLLAAGPQYIQPDLTVRLRHQSTIAHAPIVADNCAVFGTLGSHATFGDSGTFRTPHWAATKVTAVRVLYANVQVEVSNNATSGREITPTYGSGTGNAVTFPHVGLEDPNGNIWPVTFNSSVSVTMQPGGYALSDWIGVTLNKGDRFFMRPAFTVSTGGLIPTSLSMVEYPISSFGAGFTTGVDNAMSGAVTGNTFTTMWVPAAIFGITADSNYRGRVIIGDSITAGFYGFPFNSSTGWAGLAFGSQMGAVPHGTYGWTKLATGSAHAAGWLSNSQIRQLIVNGEDDVILALGVNDFGTGAQTAAQVETSLTELISRIHLSGSRCYLTTYPPAGASSTDAFTTLANQTIAVSNAARVTLNNDIRNAKLPVEGFFEIADQCESARDSGKWPAGVMIDSGTATGGSTTTLADTGKTWSATNNGTTPRVPGLEGCVLKITGGANAGATRIVYDNTATVISIDAFNGTPTGAFSSTISAGDTYQIWRCSTNDGTHPSVSNHKDIANNVFTTNAIKNKMQG